MARLGYSLIYIILLPVILLRMWLRGRQTPAYRQRWRERFLAVIKPNKPVLWVHTVSLGESIAASPLIEKLINAYPDYHVLVTTTTPTGSDHIRRHFAQRVLHQYLPYDLPLLVHAFIRRVRPKIFIMMETELWPNYLAICAKRNIPAVLINARLSARSARRYARFSCISRPMLKRLHYIACQNRRDMRRFKILGVDKEKIQVVGSVKYDFTPEPGLKDEAYALFDLWPRKAFVWIAASTHEGEETQILAAHRSLREACPEARLILVPRHPERFEQVAALIRSANFPLARRSDPASFSANAQVLLGDSMGELMLYYARAQVAFVGGSLIQRGGHNPLEPAALALPVLTGPHVFNFALIYSQMFRKHAALKIENEKALASTLIELAASPAKRRDIGGQALHYQQQNRGATERTKRIIDHFLSVDSSSVV